MEKILNTKKYLPKWKAGLHQQEQVNIFGMSLLKNLNLRMLTTPMHHIKNQLFILEPMVKLMGLLDLQEAPILVSLPEFQSL